MRTWSCSVNLKGLRRKWPRRISREVFSRHSSATSEGTYENLHSITVCVMAEIRTWRHNMSHLSQSVSQSQRHLYDLAPPFEPYRSVSKPLQDWMPPFEPSHSVSLSITCMNSRLVALMWGGGGSVSAGKPSMA